MFDWIPTWEHDREIITQSILEQKSDLKIILKTKDEIYLLRRWLDHHIEIVGLGNIIVFDNNSSNPLINEIYLEYRDRIVVARFSDYPDDIHHPDRFPDLYSSLRES